MRKYIENLTDDLIRKHRYDEASRTIFKGKPAAFRAFIAWDLFIEDVADMRPETLGKILCSFETGDVMSPHPGREVSFSDNCENMLRELVARCLAYAIEGRFNPVAREMGIPPYCAFPSTVPPSPPSPPPPGI